MTWTCRCCEPNPGGLLPVGTDVGEIIFWNGTAWVSNADGTPGVGQILVWDGATWVNSTTELIPAGAQVGNILVWDGNNWVSDAAETPAAIVRAPLALQERPFHYVVPIPTANTFTQVGMTINFQNSAALGALSGVDLRQSSFRSVTTRVSSANGNIGGPYSAGVAQIVLPGAPGAGGFFMVGRYAYTSIPADGILFFGVSPAVRGGGAAASNANNTICIGADTADANVSIITRDNVGTIVKTGAYSKANLVINDPNTNGPCVLDFGLQVLPGANVATAWIYDASNGIYRLGPTDVSIAGFSTVTALHISGAGSTVSSSATAFTQEFMHFYGYW